VNRGVLRKRRLQNRAWSLVAALLPVTSGWASEGSDGAAMKADTSSTAVASNSTDAGNAVPNSASAKIPPPRPFNLTPARDVQPVSSQSKPKIPPPRKFDTTPMQPAAAKEPPRDEAPVLAETSVPTNSLDQVSAPAPRSAPLPDLVVPPPVAETPPARSEIPAAAFPEVSIPAPEQVDSGLSAEFAASASTAPALAPAAGPAAPSTAADPVPMSEPVEQALKTLTATPAIGADSATNATPVAPPVPTPSSDSDGEGDTSQTPLKPTVETKPETTSMPKQEAIPAQALKGAEREQDSKAAIPPQGKDDQVEQTECATCGAYHGSSGGGAFHAKMGCADGMCIPGRQPCPPDKDCNTVVGAFLANMYQELCCPDPCYQPKWEPAAFASFFADYARPRTVTRIRYDNLEDMTKPDRNQFWIQNSAPTNKNNSAKPIIPKLRLQEVYLYQEVAAGSGSFFVEIPYRQINPNFSPSQSGFSDINFGIKSMFYDRELLQLSFQFRTYTPSGNAINNLGTGHFALDPSIMGSLKLGPDTFAQGQFGNWIPLAGNPMLAGGIFYGLTSINQVLWYPRPDSPLIATLEMDFWAFENGGYTNAVRPGTKMPQVFEKGGGVAYFNIGPGLRQSICNKLDVGGAITFATASPHWAQPWFRFEVRFLF
jgi:hypothetical protein